jgi:hypothetical protein
MKGRELPDGGSLLSIGGHSDPAKLLGQLGRHAGSTPTRIYVAEHRATRLTADFRSDYVP